MAKTALRVVPSLEDSLPSPRWGDEFALCRERSAYSKNQAITAELKSLGLKVSTAMISRLEDAETVPTLLSQRIVATAAMVLYGRSPGLLGLDIDDLPAFVYDALVDRFSGPDPGGDQRSADSRCTAHWTPGDLATITPIRWSQLQLEEAA